jgi:hypothetical protein
VANDPVFAQEDTLSVKKESESSLIKYFSDLKLDDYTDRTVGSFIASVKPSLLMIEILPSSNPFYQGLIKLSYPEGIYANVFVKEFRRANPNGICKKRKLRLAHKEIIADIHILNEIACLQGCR